VSHLVVILAFAEALEASSTPEIINASTIITGLV
jgi:hypothetical protein